jgi:hypothetical protein
MTEIRKAEELLLRGDRVTLTSPVVPTGMCRTLIARHGDTAPLAVTELQSEVLRVATGFATQLGRDLNDREKQIANSLGSFLALMPGGKARSYVELLISEKIWFPDRKSGPGLEKRAVERQTRLAAMAAAHLKEAQRRDAEAAEELRFKADRASKTPEQRKAFVDATLAKFRENVKCA